MDDICEALDALAIENLELMEKKVEMTVQLENLIRSGHIDLAKARYIRGKESVGMLQIPSEENDAKSLYNLETSYTKSDNTDAEEIPSFDISLKQSNEDMEEPQNPIKWFGVLVPRSLKTAQKAFQDALYLTVRLANVQSQLTQVTRQTDSLKVLKQAAA